MALLAAGGGMAGEGDRGHPETKLVLGRESRHRHREKGRERKERREEGRKKEIYKRKDIQTDR